MFPIEGRKECSVFDQLLDVLSCCRGFPVNEAEDVCLDCTLASNETKLLEKYADAGICIVSLDLYYKVGTRLTMKWVITLLVITLFMQQLVLVQILWV